MGRGKMDTDPDVIAEVYLRYHAEKQEEDLWAWDTVEMLVDSNPNEAWKITCALVNRATSDEDLAYVAAGPLEDLLIKHGPTIIARVEDESEKNARLRLALSGVWGIDPSNPIFDRWYALMWKTGFAEGTRKPL